jgi:predicted permease
MGHFSAGSERIRSVVRRMRRGLLWRAGDAELREEIETHRALRQARLEREGLAPDEADRASRRALGNTILAREDARDVWINRAWDDLSQDVRGGTRALVKHPGIAITAVLSLAIGIGANAAAFSAVKAILLTPLPYPDADRLVMLAAVPPDRPDQRQSPTVPEYIAWRDGTSAFDAIATLGRQPGDLGAENGAAAEQVLVQGSTASLFQVLGLAPLLGRTFTAEEDPIDTPTDVVLIGERLWRRRFGGDPTILGRTLRLDGTTRRIVGVMPAGSTPLDEAVDIWAPVNWSHTVLRGSARGWPVLARMKPGLTLAQAQAGMDAMTARLAAGSASGSSPPWGVKVQPLQTALYGGYAGPLAILQGVVGLVLLIACANVAGLLLARAIARRTELAIRMAIGAGRRRLVRQLLTESVVLAALGGVGALGVAWLGLRLLIAANPAGMPRSAIMGLDGSVLAFAAGIAVLAALLFGTLPALHASRVDPVTSLRSSLRGATGAPGAGRARGILVVVQIAMAIVLLVGSGLLVRTLLRIRANDLRGDPRGIVTFDVRFPGKQYGRRVGVHDGFSLIEVSPEPARVFDEVWTRIEQLPGAESAAGIDVTPFTGAGPALQFTIPGRAVSAGGDDRPAPIASAYIVTPHFFATMRIPMLYGRDFSRSDTAATPWVVIVNDALARTFWPGQDPIGRHLRLDLVPDEQPREVVGVVADVRASPVVRDVAPALYTPSNQQPPHNRAPYGDARLRMYFVARTSGAPLALVPAIRQTMTAIDPERPAADVHLLTRDVARLVAVPRYMTIVMGVFAGMAMLLAGVGLYGVIAHGMAQRTREIGIRVALGADRSDVWRLALAQTGTLLAAGLVIGIGAALVMTRLIASALWGVTPTDAPTYAAVAALMVVVALASTYVPARRAARIAPTVALKSE